jgi:rhamnulokinase
VTTFAAVDLGASNGRVLRGIITAERLEIEQVHRFRNEPLHTPDGLHWDIGALFRRICRGLASVGPVDSVGIDSWGVDYGLLDADGALLGLPYHYRDRRTAALGPAPVDPAALFRRTGIADLPINTLHQLRAEPPWRLASAHRLLMIPDLLGYWLTGRTGTERSNASTTGLYSFVERDWDRELIGALGLPDRLFGAIADPGSDLGALRPSVRDVVGDAVRVLRVASHDTASAVAAVPAESDSYAYICTGTWSLVGLELPAPLLSPAARAAGFSNETGVRGYRYLRNVMGLFLLQECLREWPGLDAATLASQAARLPALRTVIDIDDPVFHVPSDTADQAMTARIASHGDGPAPTTPAEFTRCILDSLALGHARAIADAVRTSGRDVDVVHLVGGGARNELLCQLTADACGRPVAAGPVEATALGNLLAQAIAAGVLPGWPAARRLVAATHPPKCYLPDPPPAWHAAAARVRP